MTYLKTALVSVAALAIAAPAFADGHTNKNHDGDMKTATTNAEMTDHSMISDDMMMSEDQTMTMGAPDMYPSKVNDTVGEVLQADGEPSMQSDDDIIVEDYTIEDEAFRAADDDGMIADNAIVVPGSAGTLTTVTCPAGTTAQVDMTCMITGDYSPNLDETQ